MLKNIKSFFLSFKGDKQVWVYSVLLMIFSLLTMLSTSTNLMYQSKGSVSETFWKHFKIVVAGFVLMFVVHKIISYRKIRYWVRVLWFFSLVSLIFASFSGQKIEGSIAGRWIKLGPINIQPSLLVISCLVLYISFILQKYKKQFKDKPLNSKPHLLLWIPIFLPFFIAAPSNLSTASMMLLVCGMVMFVAQYPIKKIAIVGSIFTSLFVFYVLLSLAFPNLVPSRANTWISRIGIENVLSNEENKEKDTHQIDQSKMAIARGGVLGVGAGDSVQKNLLPESSNDFVYAVIVEEYGLVAGAIIIVIYLLLLWRFTLIAVRTEDLFGKYIVIGLGYFIILQAFINISVVVDLIPTTGQMLPLISRGGSSYMLTCLSLGLILNISRTEEEIIEQEKNELEKQKKEQELIENLEKNIKI